MSAEEDKELADKIPLMLSLALDVADHSARSDIEIYAYSTVDGKGNAVLDTGRPGQAIDDGDGDWRTIVSNAVRYVELRQELKKDALPYTMTHIDGLVWFEDRT